MHRDDDRGIAVTELPVTSPLADLEETSSDECLDNLGPAYNGKRRIQAEIWNVVTIGWLRSNGSFSSSK